MEVSHSVYFKYALNLYVKNHSIKFFLHIFNMSVTYQQSIKIDTMKAVGGVDFTKYAILTIIQYVQWSRIG